MQPAWKGWATLASLHPPSHSLCLCRAPQKIRSLFYYNTDEYLSIFLKTFVSCSKDSLVAACMTCTAGHPCLQPTHWQLPDLICCRYLLFLKVEWTFSSSLGSLERAFPVQYFISLGPICCLGFPSKIFFMLLKAKPLIRDWTTAEKSDYLAEAWQQSGSLWYVVGNVYDQRLLWLRSGKVFMCSALNW